MHNTHNIIYSMYGLAITIIIIHYYIVHRYSISWTVSLLAGINGSVESLQTHHSRITMTQDGSRNYIINVTMLKLN